ncbi:MAG: GntR family transcriptional regulator [Gaiellales bacterium]
MSAKAETTRAGAKPAIADVLREGIRQGLLAPGQPLIQASIADAMGVSRIPVREALHALASEGLVTFSEDGGARVTQLAPEEVDELWTLRALLESQMAPAIVGHATDGDVAALRAIVADMDDLGATAWSDRNFDFHQHLHRVADMPYFADMALRVLTMIEPYSRVAVTVLHEQGEAQTEHHAMIAAIEQRDAAELERLLLHHSNRARKALLAYAAEQEQTVDRQAVATEAARSLADRLSA